jgi:hypothetical protein
MIRSREELKQYALRALGAPVIEVNVADEQLEDRLDDAIEYYNMYHYDGVERMYLKHLITSTNMTNKYIQLPDDIRGITRVFSLNANSSNSILNYETQFRMDMIANLHNSNITDYQMTMNHLQMLDTLLSGQNQLRFNKNNGKLYIDMNWDKLSPFHYIIVDCYQAIDPELETKMYDDVWLKAYVVAKFKMQWGQNLSKYNGVSLPGGVTIDGQSMYDTAVSEISALEQQAANESGLLDMFIG